MQAAVTVKNVPSWESQSSPQITQGFLHALHIDPFLTHIPWDTKNMNESFSSGVTPNNNNLYFYILDTGKSFVLWQNVGDKKSWKVYLF